jgi:hypothetical protein
VPQCQSRLLVRPCTGPQQQQQQHQLQRQWGWL